MSVQEGLGHVPGGSPLSPTRPPSMRRRQSMQIMDLEQRLDQVVSENRLLADAKLRAERSLDEVARDHAQSNNAMREAIETRDLYLTQKNQELEELRHTLNGLQNQVAHLSRINEGLSENRVVDENHEERYRQLESDHNHVREQWQQSTRELEDLRQQHAGLSGSMESIVATQVASALASKNAEFNRTQEELRRAHEELEQARQQIRTLQQQILASKSSTDSSPPIATKTTSTRNAKHFVNTCSNGSFAFPSPVTTAPAFERKRSVMRRSAIGSKTPSSMAPMQTAIFPTASNVVTFS